MGLCAVLCVISLLGRDNPSTRALYAVLAALVALRAVSALYGDSSAYMAIAALVWAVTSIHVFRESSPVAGGILAMSALCYFWANYSEAPRVVGSMPFVVSDVLLIVAIVWIGSSGICSFYQRTLDLARSGGGHNNRAAGVSSEVASKTSS